MKMVRLLFDEPLSEDELCKAVADTFPNSLHIRLLGHGGAQDPKIWEVARQHGCLLVSKDEDFQRLAVLRGAPPKFVWIRLGNCSTDTLPRCFAAATTTSCDLTSKTKRPSLSWAEPTRGPTPQWSRRR